MTSIVLFTAAALVLGVVFGSALARWQPAFPALFLAGVVVFLAWSVVAVWSADGVGTMTALTGFFALFGWIVGIVGGIGFRRRPRRPLRGARPRVRGATGATKASTSSDRPGASSRPGRAPS